MAHLRSASERAVLVSLADKVHNLRSIVGDYRVHGESLWTRFNPDADQVGYYGALHEVFRVRLPGPLIRRAGTLPPGTGPPQVVEPAVGRDANRSRPRRSERKRATSCPRTLLPAGSRGGANVPRAPLPGDTVTIPPPMPLLPG